MRMYADAMEMVREVERDLFEMGVRVQPATMQDKDVHDDPRYETVELQAYGYVLLSREKMKEMVEYLGGNLRWAYAEAIERTVGGYRNPGEAWKFRREIWSEFIRDGQFAYTYNERIREQLPQVIRELRIRPNTRQAILTVYDRHQDVGNWGGKDRVPCSLNYQFYRRADALHMIYSMRSCDFLTHFCHDVWLASYLQAQVASALETEVGRLTHFTGSLHAYRKDMEARNIF